MTTEAETPRPAAAGTPRFLRLVLLALLVAGLATVAAHALHAAIAGVTRLVFFGQVSLEWIAPAKHRLGAWVILAPALGGLIIALLARFGSRGVVGHGIPEVMQQVLGNRSRISPKVALLKPLAAVVSIGTGGPFGAEGPVIAMGGSVGSLLGQAFTMTASERKILLAAGAAAGMTAIFGSPLAATLLAVELLLFELGPRSLVPVALAAVAAQALRFASGESSAVFPLAEPRTLAAMPGAAWALFVGIGIAAGALSVFVGEAVHRAEHLFHRLPACRLLGPPLGGLIVGFLAWREPRVLGAGYDVIEGLLSGDLAPKAIALVCGFKLCAWVASLGSGTTGGTLAPMLVIGGGIGALVGELCPWEHAAGVDPGLAALAGMIAFFAGGSRALLASVVLGLEITQQAGVLWPLATAATCALATARMISSRSLMSHPVEQGGLRVPGHFDADAFAHVKVSAVMEPDPRTIPASLRVGELADRIGAGDPSVCHHTALLVTDEQGALAGIISRRDLLEAVGRGRSEEPVGEVMTRELVLAHPHETLAEAVERMHRHDIGRLPVVDPHSPRKLVGYLGRAAILSARRLRWAEDHEPEPGWLAAPGGGKAKPTPPETGPVKSDGK